MNIKEFLLANYIYILIVIALIIITIIGFLADKKKSKEKKGNNDGTNGNGQSMSEANNSQVFYQLTKDNVTSGNQNMNSPQLNDVTNFGQFSNSNVMPVNNSINPNQNMSNRGSVVNNMPINNNVSLNNNNNNSLDVNMPGMTNNISNMMNQTTPQVVEPINNNMTINSEPMYQPLSEQKPIIMPNNQTFNTFNGSNQLSAMNNQTLSNNLMNNGGELNRPNRVLQPESNNQNLVNPMPIPSAPSVFNVNPTPIPPFPPTSVMPQQTPMMPNNGNNNIVPNQVNSAPPQPVNFVYGSVSSQNNNGEYR